MFSIHTLQACGTGQWSLVVTQQSSAGCGVGATCFTVTSRRSTPKVRWAYALIPAEAATHRVVHDAELLAGPLIRSPHSPSYGWPGSHGGRHVWRQMELPAEDSGPGPREYHTLTALSGGRLIAFGGASAFVPMQSVSCNIHSSVPPRVSSDARCACAHRWQWQADVWRRLVATHGRAASCRGGC